jgi:hypothetical protein
MCQRVMVKRAGEVIPKIVRVVEEAVRVEDGTDHEVRERYRLPALCPACGSKTEREDGGILVRCTGGYACEAQVNICTICICALYYTCIYIYTSMYIYKHTYTRTLYFYIHFYV